MRLTASTGRLSKPVLPFRRRSSLADDGGTPPGTMSGVVSRLVWAGHDLSLEWKTKRRIPPVPREAVVPLDEASLVLLVLSQSPWYFSPAMYAAESGFAHALAERGHSFALTE